MVRYERSSFASRYCLPLVRGLRRPFKPTIVRLFITFLFWATTFAILFFCANLDSFRTPRDQHALPDLLFDLFPTKKVAPLPQVLLYTLLASAVARMMFHKEGLAIARRFAAIAGCIYVLRSLTLIATSFPNPQARCQDYTPSWRLSVLLNDSCGDMMGHTVNLPLAALVWSQYSKRSLVKLAAWGVSVTAMVLFTVDRSHYTIDVVISLLISVFVWKSYHMSLRLPVANQNRIVRWLEKMDAGAARGMTAEREHIALTNSPSSNVISLSTLGTQGVGGREAIGSPPTAALYKEFIDNVTTSISISPSVHPTTRYEELVDEKEMDEKEMDEKEITKKP